MTDRPDIARAPREIPDVLQPLLRLSFDLRVCWRKELSSLFSEVSRRAWAESKGNAVAFWNLASDGELRAAAENPLLLESLRSITQRLREEDETPPYHPAGRELSARGESVAYFSAEFGLSEVLPIYAGGLGVLAGDLLKSASDLALPVTGVGLFYREGYFRQRIGDEGRQEDFYTAADPSSLPLELPEVPDGGSPLISIEFPGRTVWALIRQARVGRVMLYLLDADIPQNASEDRDITRRLYGGARETRLQQEILLGIGGLRALDRVGRRPAVRHLNEGHAAFVTLEKIRQLMAEDKLSFSEAREAGAAGNLFTTHTPVAAGIDLFPRAQIELYLEPLAAETGLSFDEIFELGRDINEGHRDLFSMAVLALRLSARSNAVSRLHALVSRHLWRPVTPELPEDEVPIESVTNGVHAPTWTDPSIADLSLIHDPDPVDGAELWRRHEALRVRLTETCRARTGKALDPRALTIGFARRFATYKRATLLFHDPARLAHLLHLPDRPVQFLFSGKAHPQDEPGKEFLTQIAFFASQPAFQGRIVFLPDYDMALARELTSGCDVWMNNPERPLEASGTSGMKAAMNGVLNLSVLDGWWDEAPYEQAGFAIGPRHNHAPKEEVAAALYDALEHQVIPMFFDRDERGVPVRWIEKMKFSASTLSRLFSSDRMTVEYLERGWLPAARRTARLREARGRRLRDLVRWKRRVAAAWNEVSVESVELRPAAQEHHAGLAFEVEARINLGRLEPRDVSIEWRDPAGKTLRLELVGRDGPKALWRALSLAGEDLPVGTLRIFPQHPELAHEREMRLLIQSAPSKVPAVSGEPRLAGGS